MKHNTTYSSHPSRASRAAHRLAKEKYPTYDTSLIQPKKSNKGIIIAIIVIAVVVVAIGIAIFAFLNSSSTLAEGKTVEVDIAEGDSSGQIANKMADAGVVSNTFVFNNTVNQMNASSSLKPGHYYFEGGKSVKDYVQMLCDGPDANTPKVLVAEGMKLSAVADAVQNASKGRITSSEFIEATKDASVYSKDYDFLEGANNNSLEGFLFPKTYLVRSTDKARDLVIQMLDQFKEETANLDISYPKSKNLDWYDIVKLASIVEKESTPSVTARVASVFYNRLSSGMHLNSDATTAYEVGHDPTPEEVHADSPYSTYTNYGLPPTPICSPGLAAINAVCNPEITNYLYFYFYNDDSGNLQYKFSESFDEHQDIIVNHD